MPPLLELLKPDADSTAALTAAMHAAAALRYLCGEDSLAASIFCRARGLGIVASRIAREPDGDREILGLPGTLGVSCVRGECKSLMGESLSYQRRRSITGNCPALVDGWPVVGCCHLSSRFPWKS